jgi:hypothetical protein
MKLREFTLLPFPGGDHPDLSIGGSVVRHGDALSLHWELAGQLGPVSFPALSDQPERKTRLWEETCFEFFLAPVGTGGYWEVNVSPSGHWNVYAFESYRLGMREEKAYRSLPVRMERRENALMVSLDLDLGRIVPAAQPLHGGVSAVIGGTHGELSYWALCHRGPKPDFHQRDGFAIEL